MVAEALAWFFGGFFDIVLNVFGFSIDRFGKIGGVGVILIGGWLLWRVGLAVAPLKICFRCKGSGHYKVGLFFGRRSCGWCGGTGTRSRVGAGRD